MAVPPPSMQSLVELLLELLWLLEPECPEALESLR